jgi:hypothetical protein
MGLSGPSSVWGDFPPSHARPFYEGPPELVIFYGGNFLQPAAHDWEKVDTSEKGIFWRAG